MSNRDNLRTMVRGAYDIQKLRIQMGNRIVGTFKVKLGQEPGADEDSIDGVGKQILDDLRKHYRKITDGVAKFPTRAKFKSDGVIDSYTELCLIAEYAELDEQETRHFRRLTSVLEEFPIYNEFLEPTKGCGPAMSGVIISEIDISKARHPSSLWKYGGLDVVSKWLLQGKPRVRTTNLAKPEPLLDLPVEIDSMEHADEDGATVLTISDATMLARFQTDEAPRTPMEDATPSRDGCVVTIRRDGYEIDAEYRCFHLGGRSRRARHLIERAYVNKDGDPAVRNSITFNPFLKTKLAGVLASSFLRASPNKYRDVYDGYKHRLEQHPAHVEKSKGHRHSMALRYMIKMFLIDLHAKWRALEGLPVSLPYHEAKLGIKHAA